MTIDTSFKIVFGDARLDKPTFYGDSPRCTTLSNEVPGIVVASVI